ncbi:MAG: hypothetical protein BWX72_00119 [Firmicutes bacterium ADurb.Bin080]|nr:MAG: hypothetical protein BWX72_00119 [Firmicutes bacterium ADurb.Bin080]
MGKNTEVIRTNEKSPSILVLTVLSIVYGFYVLPDILSYDTYARMLYSYKIIFFHDTSFFPMTLHIMRFSRFFTL